MKILYYSPAPGLSLKSHAGYATHMREVIRAFENRGHEVCPVINGDNNNSNNSSIPLKSSGFKKIIKKFIPKILWESLKDKSLLNFDKNCIEKLEQKIKEFNPDVIYERVNYIQLSGSQAAKKHGIPHLIEINSPYPEERIQLQGHSWFMSKANKNEKEILADSEKVYVVSSALKKHLISKHKISEEKFIVTPNAINLNAIHTVPLIINQIISQYRLKDKIVLGFVGSFFRWHGIDMLIRAFGSLAKKHTNIVLLIIGDGDIKKELMNISKNTGVGERVIFTGNVEHEDVFNYYKVMDIAVMPNSNWYGSPVKIFEYGAMGKSIIAPNYKPLQDVMTHEIDGLLIEPDEENLMKSIEYFLNNPEKRIKMANQFKEKVHSHYTWDKIADCILEPLN